MLEKYMRGCGRQDGSCWTGTCVVHVVGGTGLGHVALRSGSPLTPLFLLFKQELQYNVHHLFQAAKECLMFCGGAGRDTWQGG